jgi:serine/threonine-protein kinase
VAAFAPAGDDTGALLATRREEATAQLAGSVAALEGIRLDLLRLHAGASDLAPLTTLMDAARALGDDIARLADAQREVSGPSPSLRRIATPV